MQDDNHGFTLLNFDMYDNWLGIDMSHQVTDEVTWRDMIYNVTDDDCKFACWL